MLEPSEIFLAEGAPGTRMSVITKGKNYLVRLNENQMQYILESEFKGADSDKWVPFMRVETPEELESQEAVVRVTQALETALGS